MAGYVDQLGTLYFHAGKWGMRTWPYPYASMFKPSNAQSAFSPRGVCHEFLFNSSTQADLLV